MKQNNRQSVRKLISMFSGGKHCAYPQFSKPYQCNNFIISTDTKIFIRVKYDLVGGEYEKNNLDIIEKQETKINSPRYFLKKSAIEDTFGQFSSDPSLPTIPCPFCNDDNRVSFDFIIEKGMSMKLEYTCPMCDGKGIIKSGFGYYIALGDHIVDAQYMALLYMAMSAFEIDSSELCFTSDGVALFHLSDGIDIALSTLHGKLDGYAISLLKEL